LIFTDDQHNQFKPFEDAYVFLNKMPVQTLDQIEQRINTIISAQNKTDEFIGKKIIQQPHYHRPRRRWI